MEKLKIDERAVKIAKWVLAKELRRQSNQISDWYLDGYHSAICDFIQEYTGEDLRAKALDAINEASIKFQEAKK